MFTIVTIALVFLFGLLFASMAIVPVLIESEPARSGARSRASSVLVKQPANPASEPELPRAA